MDLMKTALVLEINERKMEIKSNRNVDLNHSDKYKCVDCDQRFFRTDHLQTHLVEAHSDFVFKCIVCNVLFIKKSLCIKHIQTAHFKKKMSRCEICKNFVEDIHLETHYENKHKGSMK